MAITLDQLAARIEDELTALSPHDAGRLRKHLVTPHVLEARWEHRLPGTEIDRVWVIAECSDIGIGVAFCESAYGPQRPWAPIWLSGPRARLMPDDAAWSESLAGAVLERHQVFRYCCGTMQAMCRESETRAAYHVFADRPSAPSPFENVCIDPGDLAPPITHCISISTFILESFAIEYCPWCGASLTTPPTP